MAAARVVTVNGLKYNLPKGMTVKIALEKLMMMLPAIGQAEAVWVSVTRIEAVSWKPSPAYSQFRVRRRFAALSRTTGTSFGRKWVDRV